MSKSMNITKINPLREVVALSALAATLTVGVQLSTTALAAASPPTVTVRGTFNVAPEVTFQSFVACPQGMQAMSGGYFVSAGAHLVPSESQPFVNGAGWQFSFNATTNFVGEVPYSLVVNCITSSTALAITPAR